MAFLTNNVSSSSNKVADLAQKIFTAINAGSIVYKLELNANPTKVLARQAEGQLLNTITNLGGCGTMLRNSKNGKLFWTVDNKIGSYDENDVWHPDNNFGLNLSLLQVEESEDDKLIRELFAAKGKVAPVGSPTIKELKIPAHAQRVMFETTFETEYANLTFNDNDGSLESDEDVMKTQKGLLTVYFCMDKSHISEIVKEDKATKLDKVYIKPDVLHVEFEEGKTVYNAKPKNVVSKDRLNRGVDAMLAAMNTSSKNADGNVVLSESFFEAIAIKKEEVLSKIGTGKKAHLDAKKALIAAVESGSWDFSAEDKLVFIARRGFNVHYTMNDHQSLMSSLRKQLVAKIGDAAEALLTSPITAKVVVVEKSEETVVAPATVVDDEINTSAEPDGWVEEDDVVI